MQATNAREKRDPDIFERNIPYSKLMAWRAAAKTNDQRQHRKVLMYSYAWGLSFKKMNEFYRRSK